MNEAGPAQEPTAAQLTYGLKLIRLAIAASIAILLGLSVAFVVFADVPAVPLIPIVAVVALADLGFLVLFGRMRGEQIRSATAREASGG